MLDLLCMAKDIACGCKYMEDNHFIHRLAMILMMLVYRIIIRLKKLDFVLIKYIPVVFAL